MQSLRSQSFDLFGRYSHVWAIRNESLPSERLRILDVGDPFGTIASLFPDDDTVSLDIYADHPPVDVGHQHIVGSGFELPFTSDSFDLVCSHDTLEHLPPERRPEFLAELLRVSRGPVVVVAPFADARSVRGEHLINSYFVARLGHTIAALDEHDEFTLPDPVAITEWLDESKIAYARFGDGWLYHWVAFYYLKAHFLWLRAEDDLHRLDIACNDLLVDVDHTPPHYRTTLVLRPPAELPDLPAWVEGSDDDLRRGLDELTDLATSLGEALRFNDNPLDEQSHFGRWVEKLATDARPTYRTLSESMTTVLDVLRERLVPTSSVGDADVTLPVSPRRSVAVVLVNYDGVDHLGPCLDSLAAQDYPRELTEVLVVDNGSTDGSLELLARDYPWVTVLPQGHNTGFAPAVTAGVTAASAECVAFLNNDMRVDSHWLSELMNAYNPDHRVVCVAGQIQSWDGETVDFVEGVMNFYGMGEQVGYGKPVGAVDVRDGQQVLFACGGSMLVSRHIYLSTGGFDPEFFAYFEDVDFGWRLAVLGYEVRFAEKAISYHRMHGTSSRFPEHQRLKLYERNALRSVLKNYGDDLLAQVLAPALLLLIKRAMTRGALHEQQDAYDIGGDREPTEVVLRSALAHLHAVDDVLEGLDTLIEQRERIQRARQRDDTEIVELFGYPFAPVLSDLNYVDVQRKVVDGFGLAKMFERHRARRVLCISANEIGEKMRGPAIRAFEIAKALASTTDVAVAVPGRDDEFVDGIPTLAYPDEETLLRLAQAADIVVIQGYTVRLYPRLAQIPSVLVVDLYDPWLFENIELHGDGRLADSALLHDVSVLNELLDAGDFFICASERQRDYWLGMLSARGGIESASYAADPTLRQLIDVVPFGLPSHRPRHSHKVLKGVHPAVAEDDLVVLWGGGTWDWFDPLSVIEAFALVVEQVPNAKLYFLGLQLASPDVPLMKMAELAVQHAERLGLAGKSVIFGDWAPYETREAFLLEADVAVSAARDLAETRLAFRSRILDYFWAGLPVVTTGGDVLADLVVQHDLGVVVAPGDVAGLAKAMIGMLSDPSLRESIAGRAQHVSETLQWTNCVRPLRKVALEPWRWRAVRSARERGRLVTQDVQMMMAVRDAELSRLRGELEEVVFLRQHVEELQAIVRHKDRPYAVARKVPGTRRLKGLLRKLFA